MHDDEASDLSPARFNCPGCGEEVDVAAEAVGQLVRCPYCNTDFFASAEHLNAAVVDDTPAESFDREFEISKLRIEQFAVLRRGAIRSRSWWVITQIACLFIVLDALGQIYVYVATWRRWGIGPTIGVLVAIGAVALAVHGRRRARDFQMEIDTSALKDPKTPPDFSTLNDGSDLIQKFEDIR